MSLRDAVVKFRLSRSTVHHKLQNKNDWDSGGTVKAIAKKSGRRPAFTLAEESMFVDMIGAY